MLKKIIRMVLPLAVLVGFALPLLNIGAAQEQKTDGRSKKKTEKSKRKPGGERRKAEQPKSQ